VGDSGYESRSQNCCFAGRTLRGRVQLTIAAGAVAYRERSTLLSVPAQVASSERQSLR
jgi:dihydroorotase